MVPLIRFLSVAGQRRPRLISCPRSHVTCSRCARLLLVCKRFTDMQVIDSELRTQAFQLLRQLLLQADPARMEQWAGLGLTMTQVRVLYTLQVEDGLAAGELAERLNVRPSTVTRIVDRLVRNKLVARDVDDSDRRLVRHRLTKKGAGVFRELQSMGRERLTRVFDRLDDKQVERVVEALRDLIEAVEAVASEDQG